jgi:hypothetical protein
VVCRDGQVLGSGDIFRAVLLGRRLAGGLDLAEMEYRTTVEISGGGGNEESRERPGRRRE